MDNASEIRTLLLQLLDKREGTRVQLFDFEDFTCRDGRELWYRLIVVSLLRKKMLVCVLLARP